MSTNWLFFIVSLLVSVSRAYTQDSVHQAEYIDSIYIPKDLEDCFKQINSWWSDSVKNEVKNKTERSFTASAHHAVGMWMRNNWGLWKGSRLSEYFHKMGVFHPDDMSGIILTSYYRHLRNEPLQVDAQVKYCQDYWKVSAKPKAEQYPKGVGKLDFNSAYLYDRKEGQGMVHLGDPKTGNVYWLYDYYFGWKKIDRGTLKEFDNVKRENREAYLTELYQPNSSPK